MRGVEEIATIMRIASECDYIVVPAGGMTKQDIGAIPERIDILLRTDRLNQVMHYDAGDLTLGVGAGMTISEVQKALVANSQFLPLDPMLPERATVGGVLATNAKQVADYRSGKEKAFNSLVGQVMKASKGRANPAQVNELLRRKLKG